MFRFFIPRQWRYYSLLWFLMLFEFPFTVANLALFGIASPNLYRTILWAEGGKLGFNSDPSTVVYAAANYRPVDIPVVWSSFNTQYNLVIGVICMFFWLIKGTLFLLHVFYPILSLPLHIAMTVLWAVSIYVQTAPDTIDPERSNNGAPWFITKNCDIVEDGLIRGYCMQAKSAFAVAVIMLINNALFLLLTLVSLYPSRAQRDAHSQRRASKRAEKEKWAAIMASPDPDAGMSPEEQWQHMWELQQLPRTPGTAGGMKSPMTPRTRAFESLGGREDGIHRVDGYEHGHAHGNGQYVYPPPPQTHFGNGGEHDYDGKGKAGLY